MATFEQTKVKNDPSRSSVARLRGEEKEKKIEVKEKLKKVVPDPVAAAVVCRHLEQAQILHLETSITDPDTDPSQFNC